MMLASACGDDGAAQSSTTASLATTTTSADRVGGTLYTGTFESGPGFGPGEITLLLDDTGDAISVITYTADLDRFACPNGNIVSGGSIELSGRMPIDDADSFSPFSSGLAGIFDSATEAHGTYDLQYDFDCGSYVLNWTATGQATSTPSDTTESAPAVPTETATAPIATAVVAAEELERDRILIGRFWADYTDAWFNGIDSGVDWIASHNHPDMAFTRDDLACAYADSPAGYREEAIGDPSSVQSADDWILPSSPGSPSPIDGTVPRGRLYGVQVEYTFSQPGMEPAVVAAETHVAVLPGGDGEDRVWFFFSPGC
jgi:hypothetical protein